jgi:hypothetical protein
MSSADLRPASDRVVAQVRAVLAASHPHLVEHVFGYGGDGLVVWILLRGAPDDLPAWYFPDRGAPSGPYPAAVLTQIGDLYELAAAEVARVGWPGPGGVSIGFDSAERVAAAGGGWVYFR